MPLGGEGEVGTVQEFGADPGAAGGHLLHSGGSTVKRKLLAPGVGWGALDRVLPLGI